jgi:hypothetical protein
VQPSKPVFVTQRITVSLRRLLIENRTNYMSPYIIIFGGSRRCLLKNLLDPPKNLFQQHRPYGDIREARIVIGSLARGA